MTSYHLPKLPLLAAAGLLGWLAPSDELLAQQTKTDLPSGGEPNLGTKQSVPDLEEQVAYHRAFEAMVWAMPASAIH